MIYVPNIPQALYLPVSALLRIGSICLLGVSPMKKKKGVESKCQHRHKVMKTMLRRQLHGSVAKRMELNRPSIMAVPPHTAILYLVYAAERKV